MPHNTGWEPGVRWSTLWRVDTSDFHVIASVSSDSAALIEPVLRRLVVGSVNETPDGFEIDGWRQGSDPHELNRELLSALRKVERRTRLRAEWTAGGMTYRFFDYVLKGVRSQSTDSA